MNHRVDFIVCGLVLGLLACGASSSPGGSADPAQVILQVPPPAASSSTPQAVSSAPLSEAPSPPSSDELPPELSFNAPIGCAFRTNEFKTEQDFTVFHLRPHAAPYLRAEGGEASVTIPVGAPSWVVAHKFEKGIKLGGYIEPSVIRLYPAKPFVMNDFVIPKYHAKLEWLDAAAGEITPTLAMPSGLKLTAGGVLKASRNCEDLIVRPLPMGAAFEALDAVPGRKPGKPLKVMMLKMGRSISLWTEPKSQASPVAELSARNDLRYVDVLELKPGFARIVWPLESLVAFGWVKTDDLEPSKPGEGYGTGHGRQMPRVPQWPLVARLVCDKEIPLIAEAEKIKAVVGAVEPNTEIEVIEQVHGLSRVWVRVPHVYPLERTSPLWARQSDLKDCQNMKKGAHPGP